MRAGLLAAVGTSALISAETSQAETLREALVKTFSNSPLIEGQREQLRFLGEEVNVARAGFRPRLNGALGIDQDFLSIGGSSGRNFSAGYDLSFPLFDGGRARNETRAAQARVEAGRASLGFTEGDVFSRVVAAYTDVIRAGAVVALNENQVRVLEETLTATIQLYEAGDFTRTDIAQAEARLSLARSNLAQAEGQLTASWENYRRLVGDYPQALEPPPPLPRLPDRPEEAEDIALANNPELRVSHELVRAAGFDIDVRRADRLPSISALTAGRYVDYLGTADRQFAPGAPDSRSTMGVGLSASLPLYQGGIVGARVRQAQARRRQLEDEAADVERRVIAETRSAFARYRAALEAIDANELAVAANQIALEGTRVELRVGTRVVLDVLNAEQELLESQVALVSARRDAYVSGFALLSAMGLAEAEDLDLGGGPLFNLVPRGDNLIYPAQHSTVAPRLRISERIAPPPSPMTRTGSPTVVGQVDELLLTQAMVHAERPLAGAGSAASAATAMPLRLAAAASPILAVVPPIRAGERDFAPPPSAQLVRAASNRPIADHPRPLQPRLAAAERTEPIPTRAPEHSAQHHPSRRDVPPPHEPRARATASASVLHDGAPRNSIRQERTRTLNPAVRPTRLAGPYASDVSRPASVGAVVRPAQPAPQVVSDGRRFVVQLGAFQSLSAAQAGWRLASSRLGLEALRPLHATVILPARGRFHRLSVGGFGSQDEAARACRSIRQKGGECFVRAAAGDAPLA